MNSYHANLLHEAIKAAVLGGEEILTVYQTPFHVEYKQDQSPVTLADKKASEKITECLCPVNIPVLSEEEDIPDFEIRKNWERLWIVDPLDGTKEFVKKNGEFTVNIALLEKGELCVGVIYSPVNKNIYFAAKGFGAYKIQGEQFESFVREPHHITMDALLHLAQKMPFHQNQNKYVVVASLSHMSKETYKHIEELKLKHNNVEIINKGSSIKLCLVAEGTADEYPRFGPTMEWDTAAGQAILEESGAYVIQATTGEKLPYNKPNLLNDWFIAKWVL